MKKLIGLSILGLLLSGCKPSKVERDHEVKCWNLKHTVITYDEITSGNVIAFVAKGHSILAYRDENNKVQVIPLVGNDCVIY
jgi:hypothetical protein